ncbi:unnamed protein product, partial [Gadus morhua 'NCC']
SPEIQKLKDNISLLQIDLCDTILKELQIREQRAVDTIKTNLRYFYSFAKRFAKAKSNAGPLKDSSNTLRHRPQDMANILQEQFYSAFSDPESPDIEQTMRTPQGDRHRPRAQTEQTPSVLLCYEDLSPFCFIIHVSLILYAPFADREVEELHQIGPSTTAAAPPLRMRSLKEEEPPLGSTMEERGPSSWSFEPACELHTEPRCGWGIEDMKIM